MKAEVSFDLIMKEEMHFVEGTFRLPGGDWQVFIFMRRDLDQPEIDANAAWESGVKGIEVLYPRNKPLGKRDVLQILSEQLGVNEWQEVKGPDSMNLR
jgi:hypothetical protein